MNTNAEPIIVPNSGNSRPIINIVVTFIIYFYLNDTKIMQRYNNVTTLAIPKNKVLNPNRFIRPQCSKILAIVLFGL